MSYIQSYKELIVWQKAIHLVEEVYKLTEAFPQKEIFGITQQIRRSSVSVPSNIAEGYGRKSRNEFGQHLAIAYGSLLELETQLLLAKRIIYTKPKSYETAESLVVEVSKMLNVLLGKYRNSKLNAKY